MRNVFAITQIQLPLSDRKNVRCWPIADIHLLRTALSHQHGETYGAIMSAQRVPPGFRTIGNLLDEARLRGLLQFGTNEKSSASAFRNGSVGANAIGQLEKKEGSPSVQMQVSRKLKSCESRP